MCLHDFEFHFIYINDLTQKPQILTQQYQLKK